MPAPILDRDEYIEQSYFFRMFRQRLGEGWTTQEILHRLHEELLLTTRLPMAVQFLDVELKHSGLLSTGFARLSHYFTDFQKFIIQQSETENLRFEILTALLILEREAYYKAHNPTSQGMFVYHFETIARNRLGYDQGLLAVAKDSIYDADWSQYIDIVRRQLGAYDFSDLVYVRSEYYVTERRRVQPDFEPPQRPLFAEKEGRIAKASRGRDPLFLFAALQRQLNYPEVPRPKVKEDIKEQLLRYETKMKEMEARIRILEAEARGTFDPTQFGTPEMFRKIKDDI